MILCLALLVQCRLVMDGWTDRLTHDNSIYHASIALCGKNDTQNYYAFVFQRFMFLIECCSLCDVLTAVKEHDIHVCYCHYDLETAVMSLTYLCFFSWLYSHSYQRIMWTIIGSDCMLMANPTSGLALS